MVEILVAQPVLVLAVLKFAAGVDKEHVGRRLGLVEDGDGGRDARSVEEVGRESDDGLDEVLLDGLLADFSLAGAAEQHAVRNDNAHLAVFVGHLEHVADEGPVALALGRNAAPEAVVGVVGRLVGAPLFEREGRIGHDGVELHQRVALLELRVAQRVAPADGGAVETVEQHVHHGQRPGAAVELLAVEREVVGAYLAARLDEQGTRAARRVADARAGGALGQTSQQGRNLLRCKKFSSLLPGVAGELLDEEHIGVADDVVVLEV